jgi:uncharacterized paraquat-inducible protein A
MRVWRPECPHCGCKINRANVKAGIPFACPSCRALLRIPSFYFWVPALASAAICGLLGYALGFSYLKILLFTVVFWLPVTVVFGTVLHGAFNPKIEETSPDSSDLFSRR